MAKKNFSPIYRTLGSKSQRTLVDPYAYTFNTQALCSINLTLSKMIVLRNPSNHAMLGLQRMVFENNKPSVKKNCFAFSRFYKMILENIS